MEMKVKQYYRDGSFRMLPFLITGWAVLLLFSCRQPLAVLPEPDTDAELRVWFFHPEARCESCTAIELNTEKVLVESFHDQLKNGTIRYRSINIDKRENRAITERYQISYTSLLLIRSDGTVTDFTNTSMNYASMNPEKFGELLKFELLKNIK